MLAFRWFITSALLPILFLGILSVCFYRYKIKEFPSHLHAWAESDRYALALGFQENGFDFFHPQTYALKMQFPATQQQKVEQGITAVDFPLHEYVVAMLMQLSGKSKPVIFRVYTLLYSCLGLFFFFLWMRKRSGSQGYALMMTVFVFTAPVFAYYQPGFLPSIPALSGFFIACYFYELYKQGLQYKWFLIAILFFTLSALTRTPFAIFLIALAATEFLNALRGQKNAWKMLVFFMLSFVVVGGYFIYNAGLRARYGSLFLSQPMAPKHPSELIHLFHVTIVRWVFHYFTPLHYVAAGIIVVGFIYWKKKAKKERLERDWLYNFALISTVGVAAYAVLMAKQFPDHDYYFLDTFFPLILLGFAYVGILLPKLIPSSASCVIKCLFLLLPFGFAFTSFKTQQQRDAIIDVERPARDAYNFRNSGHFLDSLHISRNAKMLVVDAYSPNTALTLMQRKGSCIMDVTPMKVRQALSWHYDYVVIADELMENAVMKELPWLSSSLERIASNGRISVYRQVPAGDVKSYYQLMGECQRSPQVSAYFSFDAPSNYKHVFRNNHVRSDFSHSQPNAALLDKDMEYGISLKQAVTPGYRSYVQINGWYYTPDSSASCDWVITLDAPRKEQWYVTIPLGKKGISGRRWTYLRYSVAIPTRYFSEESITVYLWNRQHSRLFYDDIEIDIF